MQIRIEWPSVWFWNESRSYSLILTNLTTLLFPSLSNTVKNTWTHLKWHFHFYCLKLRRSKSDLIAGLLHTPLILSKAMQSLVINTRTGLITAQLFVTLHRLMQEWGKRLHRLSHRIKPSLGFLHLPVIAFPALSPTNMPWFSPVGCCSSQCRVPKQTPVFPQGDTLCAVAGWVQMPWHWTSGILLQWPEKWEGNRAVTPHSHEPTARYYLIQSYSSGLSQTWAYWGRLDSKCVPFQMVHIY